MAVTDIRSDLQDTLIANAVIASDTTTAGAILDTADFELGLTFTMGLTAFAAGQADLLLEESDDAGMAGAVAITGDKLIGSLPSLTAAISAGEVFESVGVISNLRYVRASIVSTGTADFTALVIATEKGEYKPVVE